LRAKRTNEEVSGPEGASGPAREEAKLARLELGWLKGVRRFRAVLMVVLAEPAVAPDRSWRDPKRQLALGDYLSLFLLGLFNPVARTMRGLVKASQFPGVQRGVCRGPVSRSSFSEAQQLVEPALLEAIFGRLTAELPDLPPRAPGLAEHRWLARDSSLFAALPRMAWAFYGGGCAGTANAVRLHVSFDLRKDAPAQASITPGKTCERAALRTDLKRGDSYIGDRYYGEHHAFFTWLTRHDCRYLIRLMDRGTPTVEEELPVTAADAAQGVTRQAWVRLGRLAQRTLSERLRMIWVRGLHDQELLLVTNLPPEQLTAADAALLYKERWQVEYFFRWIKCLLGEERWHWLAESPRGVAIQLYLTLIGAVLLQLDFGRRPSKRVWELFQWYLCGMLDEATLAERLAAQLAEDARLRAAAKKSRPAR
jgi:hypothetical protein